MITHIYKKDKNGEISLESVYCLGKKESLRNAVLQLLRNRYDTWNYKNEDVNMLERGEDYFYIHRDDIWFTRTPVINFSLDE